MTYSIFPSLSTIDGFQSAISEEEEKKQKRKGKNISMFEENPLDPAEVIDCNQMLSHDHI